MTTDSYENLAAVAQQFLAEMAKNPGIVSARHRPAPEQARDLRIEVDRERAADAGVSVDQVARTVETMLGGRKVTRYKRDAEQYDVIVQTRRARPHHAGRHREASSCAAAATRWCRCRRW